MANKLFRLKITLDGVEPAVWRRFTVPPDIPLDRLHDVIQIVMGWDDYHLHEFNIGGKKYTEIFDEIIDEEMGDCAEDGLFHLNRLVKRKGTEFSYVYDFGDDWAHTLVLEDPNHILGKREDPIACLEGAGACPPEDVGGIGGYAHFCEVMADPMDEEHEEYKTWFGGPFFKPEAFDHQRVYLDLLRYVRWSRLRQLDWDPEAGLI